MLHIDLQIEVVIDLLYSFVHFITNTYKRCNNVAFNKYILNLSTVLKTIDVLHSRILHFTVKKASTSLKRGELGAAKSTGSFSSGSSGGPIA